ncbi:type I restriction endonuclease subunit R [Lentibacillus amyloliquefaciens]|uniref:Type I restriction enzyme endonuclease subunit n=1 Tax=Lentibacillus amyloliquefaciens TaxID=1472767 RepID=A0A0U4E3E1_9BACI|nr:type I restriction endonuclease subunit R [Lentibacillus amyloliquefaciens]ALX47788.1 restriction endonuclease subunit R [Lentibacillus amyloliquefaciens]
MSYQSELQLEEEVLEQLNASGYERISIHNVQQLKANFRSILNERHQNKLDGKPLTDWEFNRILTDIEGKNVFDSAMMLRDKYVLERDDETTVYLEFFNTQKWCQNTFQVTNQVSVHDTYKSRYDVTILMNGLPLIQMELKRSGVAISEAFNQIERYRKQNYTGLFRFIQLFVVSNKMETRYYANSDQTIYKGNMFYWSDEKNERINVLKDFTEDFLNPCHAAKMISRYMVLNETDRQLIVLRPYQVYAVESLLQRALETNNNGYIWHTTGSGKTLTSFKASQILAQEEGIQKVIFLVDRKDLDHQTLAEFNKFEQDAVDFTNNTKKLLKQLGDPMRPLLVTTIQKMDNAIKSGHPVMDRYQKDKVIFIIDECHRSQFGDMHRSVREHFQNAQYFGFTGTPRFEENASQDGRATADIFDKCLHYYLIKDAIRDGNVLGFSVEYVNTFDQMARDVPDEYVERINTDEIWMADERIQNVTDHILANHHKKTRERMYTSILTVQSIPMAWKYYQAFQEAKESGEHDLNIATICTYAANEDQEEQDDPVYSRELLDQAIDDYNHMFQTNFSSDTFSSYFADVSKRMKQAMPGNKIDILIVVDMFLTGFDSKKLNTLYVDKNLKHHGLIQAFSRTNRVEKATKPYGNIVCYRDLKSRTDEAIEIFSQTDSTDTVLSSSYEEYLSHFQDILQRVFRIAPTPMDVDQLEKEEDQREFVLAYRDLANTMVKLKTFDEFTFDEATLGIGEQSFEDYKSKYLTLYDSVIQRGKGGEDGESVLDDIDFHIEVLRNDVINVQYIMDLLRDLNLQDSEERDKGRNQIHQLLDKADDDQLRLKADLIREFLDKVVPDLETDQDVDEAFYDFEDQQKEAEIDQFAEAQDYPADILRQLIHEYEFSGHINRNVIDQGLTGSLLVCNKKVTQIKQFIQTTVEKYSVPEFI